MDRNQQARDQFQLAQQRAAFARALSSGQVKILDRFANPIEKGSLVMWRTPFDLVWEVKDVVPVLDPNMPVGIVRYILECAVPVDLNPQVPQMAMTVCGRQNAPGHAQLDTPEAKSPFTPEPGVALTDAENGAIPDDPDGSVQ